MPAFAKKAGRPESAAAGMTSIVSEQVTDEGRSDPSALSSLTSNLRFWIPAVCMVVLDLWSKSWAFANLPVDGSRPWLGGLFEFRRSLNDGAVFGSFTGYTGVFIFASVLALLFVLYMFVHSSPRQRSLHVALALILSGAVGNLYDRAFIKADVVDFHAEADQPSILGRIVPTENARMIHIGDWPEGTRVRAFDKSDVTVRQQGVVRDFIKFSPSFPPGWPWVGGVDVWPWIFNVADAALVCGVVLLMLSSAREKRPETTAAAHRSPAVF